ncbi:MAG: hypothetical protein AB9835_07535 [Eubacteriales bacterium]
MKPILFKTNMVQAILDGRKSMTRRVISPQPFCRGINLTEHHKNNQRFSVTSQGSLMCDICHNLPMRSRTNTSPAHRYKSKYHTGDILWVRETWCTDEGIADMFEEPFTPGYYYKADAISHGMKWANNKDIVNWHPSIYMPIDAARIFLRITDVKAQRLQEITEQDCYYEGIIRVPLGNGMQSAEENWALAKYEHLWDSVCTKPEYSWVFNPWVWVISFERVSREQAFEPMRKDMYL